MRRYSFWYRHFGKAVFIFLGMFVAGLLRVQAGSVYDSPYVTFSSTGEAWTTNAGDTHYEHYTYGTTVRTGASSTLRNLKKGEHYYSMSRSGTIPIGKWVCEHAKGQCIHNSYPQENSWYGVRFGRQACQKYHYSGWVAYCADCGEKLSDMLFYMSDQAAASIASLDVGEAMHYYYLCPFCHNLEQARTYERHVCKGISCNQYKVEYDPNVLGGIYGGYMTASYHMYNNATRYEGREVTPVTHLSQNAYTRLGMQFVGWNTRPDGTGRMYGDGAEIYNLSEWDWKLEERGCVRLYAQWRPATGKLVLDPNGGMYDGKWGEIIIEQAYLTTYRPDVEKLSAPKGNTVHFDTHGGSMLEAVTACGKFAEWSMIAPFQGAFYDGIYVFLGQDGNQDILRAEYDWDAITLPEPVRAGWSFGGWYYDEAYTKPAGGAGDTFMPIQDITLHAQWVNLQLRARNNYKVNEGKGAVDLDWSQMDGMGKVYKLYQSRDGENWYGIHSAEDVGKAKEVNELYAYSGAGRKYTVPESGFYTLTVSGAQGGDYHGSVNGKAIHTTGGLGGRVSAKVWLNKGEIISYTVGGQNGFGGGGRGNPYGVGGGRTIVSTDCKGVLLIAGGGGGASPAGNGGAGGSSASLRSDKAAQGAGGKAGGGGGYIGGNQGVYTVHNHEEGEYPTGCYRREDDSYEACVADGGLVVTAVVGQRHGETTTYAYDMAEYTNWTSYRGESMSGYCWKVKAHSKDDKATLGMTINNIAVRHNTQILIHFVCYGAEATDSDRLRETETYAKIVDQNGKVLWNGKAEGGAWNGATVHRLTNVHNSQTAGYEIWVKASIPATSTRLQFLTNMGHTGGWLNIGVDSIYLSGGQTKTLICGYHEGQVVTSRIAYGGSNYVNNRYAYTFSSQSGCKTIDGAFRIQGENIGYLEELSLLGVGAKDMEKPDAIGDDSIKQRPLGNAQVAITWEEPKDSGTDYYHKAESYLQGSEQLLCTSNVTVNTLVSGIKGYYFVLDKEPDTVVTAGEAGQHGGFLDEPKVVVLLKEEVWSLHVAAVDVAGNVGETSHIMLDSLEENSLHWPLFTKPMELLPGENVYFDNSLALYYVRSDGKTPFTLGFSGYMDGTATEKYQPNYAIFETEQEEKTARSIIFAANDAVQQSTIVKTAEELPYSSEGDTPLIRYAYTRLERSNHNRELSVRQQFLLPPKDGGKKICVMPRVGAKEGDEVVYSKRQADKQNELVLMGDGTSPVIAGAEALERLEKLVGGQTRLPVTITAFDDLSGVKEVRVEIVNFDNACTASYEGDERGSVSFVIDADELVYAGDFTVRIYAVDNVGNETSKEYGTGGFRLQAQVKRILEPHTPQFRRGESGMLTIQTWGYADRVEVEFPAEIAKGAQGINWIFDYQDSVTAEHEEQIQFMVPLMVLEQQKYTIIVRAYKGEKVLTEYPEFSLVEGEGSILDDLRTRLR
ncbi:MAG: InlB B-repeat-containing protein [Lachnospiraceae bacterium]|nr:InlB B-repeat-containing protein [Lachnospiraceae bacterium]